MPFQPGKQKTGGRKPGVTNKTTALLKDAIIQAAENVGKGSLTAYLERQAEEQPAAFLTLLGKVLPLQLASAGDNPLVVRRVEYVIIDPKEPIEKMIDVSLVTNGKDPH